MIVMLVVLSSYQPHLHKKNVILTDVENALTIWANYDSKILNYGPASDPFPTVKRLRETIETVTDEEFNLSLTDAFTAMRDQHTRWSNIAPYGCFYVTTGVTFAFIEGDPDIANKPTLGDELQTVDGLTFAEWFKKNQFTSGGGANVFGGQRNGLRYLNTIDGEVSRLPSADSITFQFKSQADPQNSYTAKIPYVSGTQ
ncbi:hypothetical protein BASA83_003177 [Batrachochytrium salamandrivorans]|nr:hypothetical protein BASA83_003177 [Batrachochytrium salamandrivorans]